MVVVPVLRAGLGMLDAVLELVPSARVGHIGLQRDEMTAVASQYYSKLPSRLDASYVLMIDPMLATGGSAVAALDLLREAGATNHPHDLHRRRAGRRGAGRAASSERRDLHAGRRREAERAEVHRARASAISATVCTEQFSERKAAGRLFRPIDRQASCDLRELRAWQPPRRTADAPTARRADRWQSSLTDIAPNKILVRGYPLDEMMGRLGFAEAVYLLLMGELPTPAIGRMLNAVLVSSIDHGVTPPVDAGRAQRRDDRARR